MMSEFIIYIFLLSMWNVILFYGKEYGLSVILFMIPLLICIYSFLKKNKKINNKYGLLFMAPILLLSITYFMYDSSAFTGLNGFVIFNLFILMYLFTINPVYRIKKMIYNILKLIFAPIGSIGKFFKEVSNSLTGRFKISNNIKRVFKAIIIVLPIIFIVLLLLSHADQIFDSIFSGLFRRIENIFKFHVFNDLFLKIIRFFFVFVIIGMNYVFLLKEYNKEKEEISEKKNRDLFTIKLLIVSLNVIYVIFDFIQIKSLMLHKMSLGFNYATYARQGFFELLIVSIINLSIILISKNMQNDKNKNEFKFINIMSILMVFLTMIIIISSYMRMNLYENAYGYTTLRLLVYVALITEGILLIPTVMYIFNPKINIVRSYMIILISVYTIINFMNFDYIIANKNINRYYKDNKIDIEYLKNYSSDNIPLLVNFYERCSDNDIKENLSDYFYEFKKYNKLNSVFEYNLSKDKALDRIEDVTLIRSSIKGYFYDE